MRSHYEVVKIEVLGTWAHRANVERYFKYRYSEFNYPIGSLTEYFKFTNETQVVERDLYQMQAKVLSKVEQEVIGGKQDDFLSMVLADGQVSDSASAHAGLRISANLHQNFLAKPSSQRIIAALHQGDRLRDAAASALVPVEVARKVLAVMQKQ